MATVTGDGSVPPAARFSARMASRARPTVENGPSDLSAFGAGRRPDHLSSPSVATWKSVGTAGRTSGGAVSRHRAASTVRVMVVGLRFKEGPAGGGNEIPT